MRHRIVAFVALAILAMGTVGSAVEVYYEDLSGIPFVKRIEPYGDGIRAFAIERVFREAAASHITSAIYRPEVGWSSEGTRSLPARNRFDCRSDLPDIPASADEVVRYRPELGPIRDELLFEQFVSTCQETEETVWFGLGFYSGEGTTGVGGVGRYDKKSGKLEIRRPHSLWNATVSDIAVIGEVMWIGTTHFRESADPEPAEGLLRYDWDAMYDFAPMPRGAICGFNIYDLEIVDGTLWVASDFGVAKTDNPQANWPTWENFVPDPESPTGQRSVTCQDLYRELLTALRAEPEHGSPLEYLFTNLARFKPHLLKQYFVEMVRTGE